MTQNLESGVSRGLPSKWDNRMTFSVEEASEILGLSRGSAYAATITGTLPIISFGRRKLVPRAALEKLLGYWP